MIMNKIAILGSRGYVGSNLVSILSESSKVTPFSHQSIHAFDSQFIDDKEDYEISSILGFVDNFDLILFLLDSKNNRQMEQIYGLLQSLAKESKKAKIIIFSTFSIYSKWISPYTAFKIKIETISQNYKNVYILRPGVIYGGVPGGLYKTFVSLSKRTFLILPAADAITGYVHINEVAKFLFNVGKADDGPKIYPLIGVYMSLKEALYFFGFKRYMIQIPAKFVKFLLGPLNSLSVNKISSLQSLTSISSMKIPSDLSLSGSGQAIMRKIILSQFIRTNNIKDIKLPIRRFIREIEKSNSLKMYLELSKGEKYIYFKRLFEIYRLSLKK